MVGNNNYLELGINCDLTETAISLFEHSRQVKV